MGSTVARDFLVNLAAGLVGDLSSPSAMLGYLLTIGFVIYAIIGWHRRRIAGGKRGVDSWYFIALSLVVAGVAIGGAAYGIGLRSSVAPDTGKTSSTPTNVSDTHLSLKFGPAGSTPISTGLANIWRWYALASVAVVVLPDGNRKEIKSWNLFMTFEKPIDVKQVVIEGGSLPQYEVKDRDSRSTVIAFLGDILDTSLIVRIESGIGSATPPIKGDTPAQIQSATPLVASLIKDPYIDWDAQGRISLQGRFSRSGGPVTVYVTYGQAGGPMPQPVIGGKLAVEPRIKIGSLPQFDREGRVNVTLGHIAAVEGNQEVLQWGEPAQGNTKVGITWASYFGSIIFVWPDGKEEPYSFAIVAKSQDGKPAVPVIIGPDVLANLGKDSR